MRTTIKPIVYALIGNSRKGKPYVGATNNPDRLLCHNGGLTGNGTEGAKRTRRDRPWSYFLKVHGFKSWEAALWFEDKLKMKPRTTPRALKKEIPRMRKEALQAIGKEVLPKICHRWVAAAFAIKSLPGWGRRKSTKEERDLIDSHDLTIEVVPLPTSVPQQ